MEENMYCQNRISYRVQEGDSLYKLAKQFHTTVTELILLNSGVNPYNLQTGMRLTICPGVRLTVVKFLSTNRATASVSRIFK